MSMSEKRYFKTHSPKGDRQFLKLFDILNKKSGYDEKLIGEQFPRCKHKKYLEATSFYLREKILRSLVQYYRAKNTDIHLLEKIGNSIVLYKKGLHTLASKELKKVQGSSLLQEMSVNILTSFISFANSRETGSQSIQLKELQTFCANLQAQVGLLRRVLLLNALGAGKTITEDSLPELPSCIEDSNNGVSILLLFELNLNTAYKSEEWEKVSYLISTMLTLLEKFPGEAKHLLETFHHPVLNSIHCFPVSEHPLEVSQLLHRLTNTFEKLGTDSEIINTLKLKLLAFKIFQSVAVAKKKENLQEICHFASIFEQDKNISDQFPPSTLTILHFDFAFSYFKLNDFAGALNWLITIMAADEKNYTNIFAEVYCLFILSHYESGNYFYLKNQLRRFKKIFQRTGNDTSTSRAFFQFISKLLDKRYYHQPELICREHVDEFQPESHVNRTQKEGYMNTLIVWWIRKKLTST